MPLDTDFCEGFDYYPSDPDVPGIGLRATWLASNANNVLIDGRFEGKAMQLQGVGFGAGFCLKPCRPANAFCIQFAFRTSNLANMVDGVGRRIFALSSAVDTNDVLLSLSLTTIGQIQIWRGNPGDTLLGLADRVVINGAWIFLALEGIISDSVGRATLKVNGHTSSNYVGDTKPGATTQVGRIICATGGGAYVDFDDMNWIYDEAASIGESRIQLHEMLSDNDTQFDPLTGVDNAAMVNESSTDGDTSYNSSNTVGAYDRFNMSNITVNPDTIHAFVLVMAARKEDSGTRTIKHQFKLGPTVADGPDLNLSNTYTWLRAGRLTDPNGDAWLKDNINALLPGYNAVL